MDFVWAFMFPIAEVGALEGKYIRHDKSGFVKLDLLRGKTGQIKRATQGWTGESVSLERRTIAGEVADSDAEQAMAIPGGMIDLYQRTTTLTMMQRDLQIEIEAARIAQLDNSWLAAHIETLAGNSRWDVAASNPQAAVSEAKRKVRKRAGRNPNLLVLGNEVYEELVLRADVKKALYGDDPEVSDEALRRSMEMSEEMTRRKLARYLGVNRLAVGSAQYVDDAGDDQFKDVWPKEAYLTCSELSAPSSTVLHRVTWGAGLRLRGYPRNLPEYRDDDHTCQVIPFETYDTPRTISKFAGYRWKTAVS